GSCSRTVRTDLGNHRIGDYLAVHRKHHRENRDRQQKMECRPRNDRQRPLPYRLRMKSDLPLLGRQRIDFIRIRRACRVDIADELYISAKRNRTELPARTTTVVEADKFGAKAYRKRRHAYPAPATNQIVTHF